MNQATLEERVQKLEDNVAQLMAEAGRPKRGKDWRRTVGMFAGDEVMRQIDAEGRKIREADRRRARRPRPKSRRPKP